MITKMGQCIRFNETDVRVTGRVSMGVIGMKLNDDDEVVGMQMDTQGEKLLIVSENGMGKTYPDRRIYPCRREAERAYSAIRSQRRPV